jgi:hypothetical protein
MGGDQPSEDAADRVARRRRARTGLVLLALAAAAVLAVDVTTTHVDDEYAIAAPPGPADPIVIRVTSSPELDELNARVSNQASVQPIRVVARVDTDVTVTGCARAAVSLSIVPDARWYAIAQHVARGESAGIFAERLPGDPRRSAGVGQLHDPFVPEIYVALPSTVSHVRLGIAEGIPRITRPSLHRVDPTFPDSRVYSLRLAALKGAPLDLDRYGFLGPTIEIRFAADWVTRRGKHSCFVDVPSISVQSTLPVSSGVTIPQLLNPVALGTLFTSKIGYDAPGYRLLRDEAQPPPDESSGSAVWECEEKDKRSVTTNRQGCGALIPLETRNAAAASQADVVLWSTLLGAFLSLVLEFAFGGVHRIRKILFERHERGPRSSDSVTATAEPAEARGSSHAEAGEPSRPQTEVDQSDGSPQS